HELYKVLLKPIEQGWRPAKSLIVVTNGSLGLLPLSLLPSSPWELKPEAEGGTYSVRYRAVPWLVRTHALVSKPSASAPRTLRSTAAPPGKRETFIGFGDPIFSLEQSSDSRALEVSHASTEDVRGTQIRLRTSPQLRNARSAKLAM